MSLTDPYIQRARSLPAMPEVASRLLQSFEREQVSLHELAGLIGQDLTLSAKVLRLANSARFSTRHTVATLPDAAAILGLRTLRDLTLSAALSAVFPPLPGFDRMAFWRGTLAVAAYAQVLAPLTDAEPDTAYIGGLMLRTGRLLMLMESPSDDAEVERHALDLDSRIGFEAVILGCTHPELTAEMARHWNFPRAMVQAFDAAADPMAVRPFSPLGAALRLASVVADCRENGEDLGDGLRMTHPALVAHLKLDFDLLERQLPDHRLATAGAEVLMH
ncbi:HDOD domain-containing protein [Ideonella livida]|uniref:HDOD domain-containing protein n=1 Tax=Ideonella livida TaxID=2707176 RepID=A0A7C9PIN5_9BURK|nr:HDOD domain-containing protein [Ideonella livida]NDY92977.1 HDOD domain-containing protein [Ideonella livida]